MKYIHSMWSTPSKENNYLHLKKNFQSYLFSALLVKKHGHTIELYCDEKAYDLYSKIPYDKIHIVNFDEDGIDSKFWMYGKIKTYSLINEPFIHIDGDVFLFNDVIGDKFTNDYDLIIQSIENEKSLNFDYGNSFFNSYHKPITSITKIIKSDVDWMKYNLNAFNCGVVGFNNMLFKNKYVNKVHDILNYLTNNDIQLEEGKYFSLILIIEQSLLYYLAMENNVNIFDIIPYNKMKERNFKWLPIANEIGYCHMWANSKYKPNIINAIDNKIKNEFPKYYHILDEFNKKYMN